MEYTLGKELERINSKLDYIIELLTEEINEEEEDLKKDKDGKTKTKEYAQ